ncbi:hypothetical protein NPIL_394281 [Nephila pilipes]|uniref:Uncharacterized protein n=1 Tax=Nephila pilipes TaxID=299642 RepID=A0A8X6QMJ8_NEPPI|nr:hypothetical protein NPIL_394281 [Nephila pilipes]
MQAVIRQINQCRIRFTLEIKKKFLLKIYFQIVPLNDWALTCEVGNLSTGFLAIHLQIDELDQSEPGILGNAWLSESKRALLGIDLMILTVGNVKES